MLAKGHTLITMTVDSLNVTYNNFNNPIYKELFKNRVYKML